MNPAEKTALVIGGGRGLGRTISEHLARDGWLVGVLARTQDEVEETAAAIRDLGGLAEPLVANVLDPQGLNVAVESFARSREGIDALVVASGRLRGIGPTGSVDLNEWWLDVETSLRGGMICVRAALPFLKRSKAASITMLVGPGHNGELSHASGYGAAQAGLVRLVETLAVELQKDEIAVYALNPGLVPTPMMLHLLDSPEGRRWLPRFTESFAEGKEVGPEVAAEMVAWLASARPKVLSGRVVSALVTPTILETRLAQFDSEDRNRLRLR